MPWLAAAGLIFFTLSPGHGIINTYASYLREKDNVFPVYMLVVLGAWTYQEAIGKFLMKGEEKSRHPYLWGARAMFVGLLLVTVLMVWLAWRKKKKQARGE